MKEVGEGVEAEVGGRKQGPRGTEGLRDSLLGGILGEGASTRFRPSSSSLSIHPRLTSVVRRRAT